MSKKEIIDRNVLFDICQKVIPIHVPRLFKTTLVNMKYTNLLVLLFILSCSTNNNSIEGIWEVQSDYYKAIYKITKSEDRYTGTVISYDDGVRSYEYDVHNKQYIFKNIVLNNGRYVNRNQASDIIELIPTTENILKVKSQIYGKPVTENWLRKL